MRRDEIYYWKIDEIDVCDASVFAGWRVEREEVVEVFLSSFVIT